MVATVVARVNKLQSKEALRGDTIMLPNVIEQRRISMCALSSESAWICQWQPQEALRVMVACSFVTVQ